jgi:glycyl-tRNA synthetase
MEFFVKPGDDERWFEHWKQERFSWYTDVLGVNRERLRLRDHGAGEKAHYAKASTDIEYEFPFGWSELEGVASRTDFDLKAHQEASGQDLSYLDPETNERFLPWVIEPAVGVDRILITCLLDAYDEDEVKGETRVVLRLHRNTAPIQVAVMPLSKKEELITPAREVLALLRPHFRVEYDQTGGNIGKRYRRQDEIGTPFCLTIDFETVGDRAVTIRERDSMEQVRVPIGDLIDQLNARF